MIKNRILHDFQFEHYWITFSAHNMPKLEGLGIVMQFLSFIHALSFQNDINIKYYNSYNVDTL